MVSILANFISKHMPVPEGYYKAHARTRGAKRWDKLVNVGRIFLGGGVVNINIYDIYFFLQFVSMHIVSLRLWLNFILTKVCATQS